MKAKPLFFLIAAAAAMVLIFAVTSCRKDPEVLPKVETKEIEEISATTALAGGIIKSTGGSPILRQGVCFSDTNSSPEITDNCLDDETLSKTFQFLIEDLEPTTNYYLRAFAQNDIGISYGATVVFTTIEGLPVVETLEVEDIDYSSALARGIVHDEGASAVFSRGVCYATDSLFPNLESNCIEAIGDDNPFEVLLENLIPGTDYYLRAFAVNEQDSAFGKTMSFTTNFETITDIDGNEYKIHTIGEQVWMIDNLKVTRFSNGDPIPLREANSYWTEGTAVPEPAYCYYHNDESYADPYGALYNFATASDPRNVCPTGWRVMTNDDIYKLLVYIGGPQYGGDLKTTGTIEDETGLWYAPNTAATNSSGFSAIPAGLRNTGTGWMGKRAIFWTSQDDGGSARGMHLFFEEKWVRTRAYSKHYGFSIRCIKE